MVQLGLADKYGNEINYLGYERVNLKRSDAKDFVCKNIYFKRNDSCGDFEVYYTLLFKDDKQVMVIKLESPKKIGLHDVFKLDILMVNEELYDLLFPIKDIKYEFGKNISNIEFHTLVFLNKTYKIGKFNFNLNEQRGYRTSVISITNDLQTIDQLQKLKHFRKSSFDLKKEIYEDDKKIKLLSTYAIGAFIDNLIKDLEE